MIYFEDIVTVDEDVVKVEGIVEKNFEVLVKFTARLQSNPAAEITTEFLVVCMTTETALLKKLEEEAKKGFSKSMSKRQTFTWLFPIQHFRYARRSRK